MTDQHDKPNRPLPFGAIPTLLKDLLPHAGEEIDPVARARKDLKSSRPRRFWTRVEVKQQPDGFAEKYLELLSSGGSKLHTELLAPFGLDAKHPDFWKKGLDMIAKLIDELEALINVQ